MVLCWGMMAEWWWNRRTRVLLLDSVPAASGTAEISGAAAAAVARLGGQPASQTTNKRANESVDQQDKEMTGMQWWSYCDERRFRTHGSISISNANSLSISLWRARYNSLEALYLSIDARITLQGRGGGGRALAPHYSSSPVPTLSRPHSSSIRSRRRST